MHDGNETDVIKLHDENTSDPIFVIESGNVKLSSAVPLNALDIISVIDGVSSNFMEYSIEHPLNADSLIVFIELGITISVNSFQSLNNSAPISSTIASEPFSVKILGISNSIALSLNISAIP